MKIRTTALLLIVLLCISMMGFAEEAAENAQTSAPPVLPVEVEPVPESFADAAETTETMPVSVGEDVSTVEAGAPDMAEADPALEEKGEEAETAELTSEDEGSIEATEPSEDEAPLDAAEAAVELPTAEDGAAMQDERIDEANEPSFDDGAEEGVLLMGYARFVRDAELVDASQMVLGVIARDEIVFVLDADEEVARIVFDGEAQERMECFAASDALVNLTAEETLAFIERADYRVEGDIALAHPQMRCVGASLAALEAEAAGEMDALEIDAPKRIGVNESVQLRVKQPNASALSYSTSNKRYITVSKTGVIKGIRSGKAVIRVQDADGLTADVEISVGKAPGKVTLSQKSITIGVGERARLSASLPSGTASRLTWSFVDADGVLDCAVNADTEVIVQGIRTGKATIQVKTYNKKTAKCVVEVLNAPQSVSVSAPQFMGVGEYAKAVCTVNANSCGACTFFSENPEVVRIDGMSGEIVAVSKGTARIGAQAYNGVIGYAEISVKDAPTALSLSEASLVLPCGDKYALSAPTLAGANEGCSGFGYSSKNTKIATVDAAGRIKAVKGGKTTITVKAYNGVSASVSVKVVNAPKSVSFSEKNAVCPVNTVYVPKIQLNPASQCNYTLSSSDSTVAAIAEDGHSIRLLKLGKSEITVKTYNKKTAKMRITVLAEPVSVKVAAPAEMGVGQKGKATYELNANSCGACTFFSENPEVVRIDGMSGEIVAVSRGTARIGAVSYNGIYGYAEISVKDAPEGIALAETAITIAQGDAYALSVPRCLNENAACTGFSYSSANKKIATVDAAGRIKAVKGGKTTITVKAYNGVSASVSVKVVNALKSIAFASKKMNCPVGMTYTPEIKLNPANACTYRLKSSDSSVAKITADGRSIEMCKPGQAVITVESYNKKTAKMTVVVPGLPTFVRIEPSALTIGEGDVYALKTVMDSGADAARAYAAFDSSVAKVEADGTVTALKAGSTRISVETINHLKADMQLTVRKAPTGLRVFPECAAMGLDEKNLQLKLSFGGDGEGGRVSYSSDQEKVATVNGSGLIAFKSAGTAVITAKTYNGYIAQCRLTVGEKPNAMRYEKSKYRIALGDTVDISPIFDVGCESYGYEIADSQILSCAEGGLHALRLGETTITAVSYSGLKAECTVEVIPAPTTIALEKDALVLVRGVNPTEKLVVRTDDGNTGSISYRTSNSKVANVDRDGVVSVSGFGKCVITATSYNGLTAQCSVETHGLLEGRKVGIDPGHQLKANSAKERISPKKGSSTRDKVSGGAGNEYKINLSVGLKLRDMLEYLGAEVVMTRTTHDVNISNQQRAKLMNSAGVDLWLRLHCDSVKASKRGIQLFSRKTCAWGTEDVPSPSALLKNEKKLSKALGTAMKAETGSKILGNYYKDSYTGNNWSKMPCILVEMGFLSNSAEKKLLNNATYQYKLAQGMVNGICSYYDLAAPVENFVP